MKCSKCGHENRTGAKFCEECATPLARVCPNCGSEVSTTAKFCPECAHPVGIAPKALAAAPFTSPESYTPKHLAEKILISKNGLEGERKQVTVLFADLKGSMELLAGRDPEEARKLLDPVLEVMMEAIHRYEGTVNQVMGDGIMALFGAPVAHEDHAVRACYAAVRMQRRMNLYADEVQRKGGTPVQIRAGLNSGEVVVRSIGNDLHMDYTAVGQTTHLAARLLEAVVEEDEGSLRRGLMHLQAAEFLYEAKLFPDIEYTFRHALTHDVTLASLLQDRRRVLHARIVGALEALHPERLSEHVEQLAHHAFRGEVWEKAVIYLRQAAAKAFARSTHRQSATCLEEALVALRHLPETAAMLEQAVDVRLALRNSLWPLGDFEAGLGHLCDAERLATELGDQRRLGWIAAYQSEHTRQTGHAANAPAFAERALAIAEELSDLSLQVAANYYFGSAYFAAGDYRRTDDFFSRILKLLEGDRFRERCGLAGFPAAMSRSFWALALAQRGEFDQGMVQVQEGIRVAEVLDHPYSLIFALKACGHLPGSRGNFKHAVPLAERSLALSHDRNIAQLSPEVADVLGYLYALSGRVAESISLLEKALTAMESMGHLQWRSPLIVHLGEAHLLAGHLENALTVAGEGLTLACEHGHRGSEAWAHRLLGEIASQHDRPDVAKAEAHYGAAAALASELGMRPLVAHCHLGLCKLYRQTGKREQAHESLTTATTMYREMNMQFWFRKAEAEMRQL